MDNLFPLKIVTMTLQMLNIVLTNIRVVGGTSIVTGQT